MPPPDLAAYESEEELPDRYKIDGAPLSFSRAKRGFRLVAPHSQIPKTKQAVYWTGAEWRWVYDGQACEERGQRRKEFLSKYPRRRTMKKEADLTPDWWEDGKLWDKDRLVKELRLADYFYGESFGLLIGHWVDRCAYCELDKLRGCLVSLPGRNWARLIIHPESVASLRAGLRKLPKRPRLRKYNSSNLPERFKYMGKPLTFSIAKSLGVSQPARAIHRCKFLPGWRAIRACLHRPDGLQPQKLLDCRDVLRVVSPDRRVYPDPRPLFDSPEKVPVHYKDEDDQPLNFAAVKQAARQRKPYGFAADCQEALRYWEDLGGLRAVRYFDPSQQVNQLRIAYNRYDLARLNDMSPMPRSSLGKERPKRKEQQPDRESAHNRREGHPPKAHEPRSLAHADDIEHSANDLITLSQASGQVRRSKRTLVRYKDAGEFPPPKVKGKTGQPDLWSWADLRPVLERLFGMVLPVGHPSCGTDDNR